MAKKNQAKQAEAQAPETEEAVGKGGRKKLIIIIAAIVVLVLASGGATFFLLSDDPATEAELAEREKAAAEDKIPVRDGSYYVMEPEFVVSLAPGSRFRALQTKIEVYSSNPDLLDKLKKHDPMLRHHLSNVFAAKTSQQLLDREGREQLKDEVKTEIESKLQNIGVRNPEIEDLFFTQFVME